MDLTDNVIEEVQQKEGLISEYSSGESTESRYTDRACAGVLLYWNATDQTDPKDHP